MTLVMPRGQTAQPGPAEAPVGAPQRPSWGSAATTAQPGLRGDPIQEKPDGNRGPSGFRVTSRFEQSMQPQSVTGAARASPGVARTSPGY